MAHEVLQIIKKNSTHLAWMEERTLFLTAHGSRCYGTNSPDSDYDYKGFCVPPTKYYYGFADSFEQAELKDPIEMAPGLMNN